MRAKVVYPALAVILISIVIYYYLGGFSPVTFSISVKDITIYGNTFRGKYDDDSLEAYFIKARELAEKNSVRQLVVVDYFIESEDSVKQFIGVISKDSLNLPSFILEEVTLIEAKITSNPLVRPHPLTVRKRATSFANENGLKLDKFAIEIYSPSEEIEVWFPTKAN